MREKYIEFNISETDLNHCKAVASDNTMRGNYQSELHHDDNCLVGVLGELLVYRVMPTIKYVNKVTHDYEHPDGHKIEVKSVKSNYAPKDRHHFLLPEHKLAPMHPEAYIVIVQIHTSFTKGWVCGAIKKSTFLKVATLKHKGDEGKSGFIYRNNCFEITLDRLTGLRR